MTRSLILCFDPVSNRSVLISHTGYIEVFMQGKCRRDTETTFELKKKVWQPWQLKKLKSWEHVLFFIAGIDDSTHTCPEGYTIPSSLKCDGTNQCTDGSDEENCMVEEEPHFCPEGYPIPFQLKCDGVSQCSDRDHSYIT